MVSAALGSAAVPAATYKVGSREGTFAEEGNKDLHWLEQDATRMVHILFFFCRTHVVHFWLICELNSVPWS